LLVGVGQDARWHAGGSQLRPRLGQRFVGRLGGDRLGRRLGLDGRALRLVVPAEGVDARGEPEGDDGPDEEPGGDRSDRDQSVVARIRTCRWLSWFQRTSTTPRGPVKPVLGPT
jgi:hypothetical protein